MSSAGGDTGRMTEFATASGADAGSVRAQAGELDLALASLLAACPDGYRPRIHGGPSEVVDWAEALRATGVRPGEIAAALRAADEAGVWPDRIEAFVASRVTQSPVADLLSDLMGAAAAYEDQHGPGSLADLDHAAGAVSQHGAPGSGSQGDPVDTSTGHLWRVDEDLQLAGPGVGVALRRTYSSGSRRVGVFGLGWTSLLDVRLVAASDGGWLLLADDGWRQHHRREAGRLVAPRGCTTMLEERDGLVTATLADGAVWHFGDDRWLAGIGTTDGIVWTIDRSQDAVIIRGAGRELVATLSAGRVAEVHAGSRTTRYRHDGDRLLRVDHPDRQVRYGYDRAGRCTEVDRGDTVLLRTRYDAEGRVGWQQDAAGGVWRFAYDGADTTVVEPSGRVVVDTSEDGVLVRRSVDGAEVAIVHERVPTVLDEAVRTDVADAGLHGTTVTSVDEAGRPVAARGPGRDVVLEWDDIDRLRSARVAAETGVDVEVEVASADHGGSRRSLRAGDVEGRLERNRWGDLVGWGGGTASAPRWRLDRDVLRRPVAVTAPDGGRTRWSYDAAGRIAHREAPGGTTTVSWRSDGRLEQVTQPVRRASFAYDDHGMLSSLDLGGGVLRFDRDGDGTLRGWEGPIGSVEIELDAGRIVGGSDAGGRWRQLRGEGQRADRGLRRDGVPDVWLRTSGRRPVLEVDGATVVPWVPSSTTWLGGEGTGGAVVVEVDLPARSFVQRLPNGVSVSARYDTSGLLVEQRAEREGEVLFAERLRHDAAGRTVGWQHADAAWSIEHDPNGRLARVDVEGGTGWSVEHDTAGRRTAWRGPEGDASVVLDDRGRVTAVHGEDGAVRALTHDDGGRVVADGDWVFAYDATGRLVRAHDTGRDVTVEHDLDLRGLRVATRVLDGGRLVRDLRWVWDLASRVPRPLYVRDEVTGRRVVVRHDAQGYPQAVIDLDDESRSRWFVTDHLGTPRVTLDADGRVVDTQVTSPWGDVGGAPAGAPSGPGTDEPLVRFGFAGALVDDATGHLHLLARQYDPTLGRFLSPDPVIAAIGTHAQDPYGYCDGRPLQLRDPDGRWGISLPNPLERFGELVSNVDDWWDNNEDRIAPVLACAGIAGMALGTVATGGALPVIAGALTVIGMAGSAVSAIDNLEEGKHAAAALDIVGVVAGGSTLSVGRISGGSSVLGRAARPIIDSMGITKDAVHSSNVLASLGVGVFVNMPLFAAGRVLSCAPA